jgi:predicted house-cleaning noncanonical NTP pyrophosphatase (MazG superfamily)
MKYNKLVRDRIPEILDQKKIPYEQRIANSEEYKAELIKKLQEEISEFTENPTSEELADIMEVIIAMRTLPDFSDVEEIRRQKREDRGGFDKRFILKGEK